MKKICIITVYMGKFPQYFNLWLASCGFNSSIDFLLITDQQILERPNNVRVVKSDLPTLKEIFNVAVGKSVKLDYPYKLCDYKPMYGLVFHEYLVGYDFWGHCDVDLIFGDIRKFATDSILEKYDKIFPLGHLSLYRNTEFVNNLFKMPGSKRGDYTEVIATNRSCVFDERYGINKIFEYNQCPIYLKEIAADIDFRRFRMTIAGSQNINYPNQIFYFENGRCMRAYYANDSIKYDEFAYLHLQKRFYKETTEYSNFFVVSPDCFIQGDRIDYELIKRINPFKGRIAEAVEYVYKDFKFRFSRRLKNLFIK